MNPAEPNANPTAGTGPDPSATPVTPEPTAAPAADTSADPLAGVPAAAPTEPTAPAEPAAPAAPVAPAADIPATDPLAPATNTPDGQAMVNQALGSNPDNYNIDPLAGIPADSEPVSPTPGPETSTMVDPLASVSSSTPATDPLVAAPATDPFAGASAAPAAPAASADNDPLAGAVESLSSAPMDANPSAEPTADFGASSAPNFADDPSVAAAPEKSAEEQGPIKPAAPAPGSIGSSTSYTDYQASEAAKAAMPADGKKKKSSKLLIIILLAIVLIGGGVFAFIMLTSGNSSKKSSGNAGNNNSSTPAPSPTPVSTSLVCKISRPAEDLLSAGGATAWGEEITVKYDNDEITKITDVSTVEYPDSATAKTGIENFKNYYASLLANAGVTSDPFDSRYARVDGTLTVTYTGLGERLNAQNSVVFNLPVEDDELMSDLDSVKANYEKHNFVCEDVE